MTLPVEVQTKAIPLLMDPLFVLVLFWLAAALGWRVLRALGAPLSECTRLEKGALCTAVGLGLLQYVGLSLGMLGILSTANLAVVFGALTLWNLPVMYRIGRSAGMAMRSGGLTQGWLKLTVVVLCVPLTLAAVRSLTPPTDIDGLYYHLTGPLRWLQHGRMDYLPSLFHTNMPMGVDMLFMAAMGLWSDTAAKLIHFGFGLLACFGVFALGRRVRGPAVGLLAVTVLIFGLPPTRTLDLMTYAYVDMGIVAELACAGLAWVLWRRIRSSGWLAASAILCGFAATCKLTVAVSAVAFAVVTLAEVRANARPWSEAIRAGALFLGISILPLLPWMVRAGMVTGNPVYPLFCGIIPTRNWPGEASKAFETYFRYYVWGTGGAGQSWSLARRKIVLFAAMLVVAASTAIWARLDRNRDTRALVFVAGASSIVALWSTGLYLRYFLPFLPLALIGAGAHVRAPRLASGRAVWLVPAVAAAVALLGAVRQIHGLGLAVRAAAGHTRRSAYITSQYPVYPLWEYASGSLPPDSRILQVAGRGSYYIRPYCYITEAIYQHVVRMDTWEHYVSDIDRGGIGYALLTKPGTNLAINMDFPPAANEMPFAERLVAERGELLKEVAGDRLYRLRPVASGVANGGN